MEWISTWRYTMGRGEKLQNKTVHNTPSYNGAEGAQWIHMVSDEKQRYRQVWNVKNTGCGMMMRDRALNHSAITNVTGWKHMEQYGLVRDVDKYDTGCCFKMYLCRYSIST